MTTAQPKATDDVRAWRRYAGELRQALRDANARAKTAAAYRARAIEAEQQRDAAQSRLAETEEAHTRLLGAKGRDKALLDAVERDLRAGDIPAAIDRLAARRTALQAAGRRRRAERRTGGNHGRP